ncbi:putative ribonuclease H-like domain-containing protein [Tanacetum coccineum]
MVQSAKTMRINPVIDTLSIDDLYNNLRDFEQEIPVLSKTSQVLRMVAVCFQQKQKYTNKTDQIEDVDIEDMDIKWQIARMLIRMKKFYKKTGRRVGVEWKNTYSNSKVGLGFEIKSNNEVLSFEEEMNFSVFKCSKEDSIGKPSYSRFTKTNDFKGVPHPLSGDYTPKPQEEIDDSLYVYGKKGPQKPEISVSDDNSSEHSTCQSNDSEGSCGNTSEHSFETESESLSEPNEMSKSSLSHLIKDCDYYEKKMAREAEVTRVVNTGNGVAKPVWTNANRVNHANKFVPRSVQLNTGRTNINSVRPKVNSVRPKVNAVSPKVNTVKPRQPMPDENQILLKVPRHHNMYSFDIKTPSPAKGFACLIAKATSDESKLWHRRLGHINFKYLNKLVKGNLVRGLPSKVFKNDHTCVAYHKGKQHRASCKALTKVPLTKDEESFDVDVHLYRSMIGLWRVPTMTGNPTTVVVNFLDKYLTHGRCKKQIIWHFKQLKLEYFTACKCCGQTATANTKVDGSLEINATIDTIGYTITEASIRDSLQLEDATGITMLPNDELFNGIGKMGNPTDQDKVFDVSSFSANDFEYSNGKQTPLSGCEPDQKDIWEHEKGFSRGTKTFIACYVTSTIFNTYNLIPAEPLPFNPHLFFETEPEPVSTPLRIHSPVHQQLSSPPTRTAQGTKMAMDDLLQVGGSYEKEEKAKQLNLDYSSSKNSIKEED